MKLTVLLDDLRWAIHDKIEHAKGWNKKDQTSGKYTLMLINIEALFAHSPSGFEMDVKHETGGENAIPGRIDRALKHWDAGNYMNPSTVAYNEWSKTIDFEDGRHRLVAAYKKGHEEAPVLVPNEHVEKIQELTGAKVMKVNETFGFEEVPTPHRKIGQQWREGRPNSTKVKKRPNKNLWFKDQALWKQDLDLERGGNYKMVSDEDEETIVACDKDQNFAHGFWSKKNGRGITYKKPRPFHMVAHPRATFKDFMMK